MIQASRISANHSGWMTGAFTIAITADHCQIPSTRGEMPAKFCSQCGSTLSTGIESGRERPICPRCGFVVYRNPVPVALVLITAEDGLLLVHRRHAPLANYWAPPAGYIEIDESLEEGAAREVKEETGLEVAIDRLLHVYSRANAGVILVTFAAHVCGGKMAGAEAEVLDLRFFRPQELPDQPEPVQGMLLEQWFYEVIGEVFAQFRKA